MQAVENNLKHFRTIRTLSQTQAAKDLHMSADYYRKLEKGEQIPGSQYVGLFEEVFKVSFSQLYPYFFSKKFMERPIPEEIV